ncbi:lysophospholipid acyltransferase family protein [Streptomyces sp. 8L]|uniref:lysophospholipid acyltransferase family protein n=1 Tax=Streptomyces sp. 8L TaxID=2877242 RepID=UPI001CD4CD7D|nr:lysophospholipid acyltransferase family protein [Streptomyces sp. 8L]MCA1220950.1 1-acyl-sn-glycerol-3-phosphate acyltransferase [Streptomyces sp. 8L]
MSAWLPTAPCTPQECAVHGGPAVTAPAAAGRLLCGIGLLTAGVVLAPVAALLGAAARDLITRRWARALLRAFGIRVRVRGLARPATAARAGGGVLVVANHISWIDIPLIATVLPGRNLAKSEIRGWPVLGPVAAGGGTLFVERERLRALPAAVRTLADALGAGSRVVVFPEACTWCGGEGGRFTTAVFQAALDAGTAVQPVRIAYRGASGRISGAAAFVGDDTLPASLWRVVLAGGLSAEITVLPQIPAGAFADRGELATAAWEAVLGRVPAPDAAPRETGAQRRGGHAPGAHGAAAEHVLAWSHGAAGAEEGIAAPPVRGGTAGPGRLAGPVPRPRGGRVRGRKSTGAERLPPSIS